MKNISNDIKAKILSVIRIDLSDCIYFKISNHDARVKVRNDTWDSLVLKFKISVLDNVYRNVRNNLKVNLYK